MRKAKTLRLGQEWLTVNRMMYDALMKKRTAIKKAGSAYRLAKMLGISRQAVSKWPAEIPPLRVYQLQDKYPEVFWVKK